MSASSTTSKGFHLQRCSDQPCKPRQLLASASYTINQPATSPGCQPTSFKQLRVGEATGAMCNCHHLGLATAVHACRCLSHIRDPCNHFNNSAALLDVCFINHIQRPYGRIPSFTRPSTPLRDPSKC